MSTSENVANLKAAYTEWAQTKGQSSQILVDLVSDKLRIQSLGREDTPIQFAGKRGGAELASYIQQLLEAWEMVYFKTETIVADGNQVAMFGSASWICRANGHTAITPVAHLFTFENGKIVELRELFDSAEMLACAARTD